ncbi:MAG TPA: S24 family peptidase [Gammaproteobacteria bacterium]|nr:S24 family peptidase [Gammaproteobacteria bacterium]
MLAARAGIRESQLFRYIRGDNTPSLAAAAALAEAGGVSLEWLTYGRLPGAPASGREIREGPGTYGAGEGWVHPPFAGDRDSPLSVRAKWLGELGLTPESVLLSRVPDDAMTPTLQRGDLLLADSRDREVGTAGLYLLRLHGTPAPRRVITAPDGSLRLRCDNPAYPELSLPAEERGAVEVIGRVIWEGRRL